MITRIVKMTISQNEVDKYFEIVKPYVPKIKASKGCKDVKIFKDITNKSVIFSYSIWKTEEDLENYRKSEMFRDTWIKVKELFSSPAEAWSITEAI